MQPRRAIDQVAPRAVGLVALAIAIAPGVATGADPTDPMSPRAVVEALASDAMAGRDNGTPGSEAARRLLIDQLRGFALPAFPDVEGDAGYLQHFPGGTNIVALIPGEGYPGETVVIGAHYDHVGVGDCASNDPSDSICNGATDNAAGVAAALATARSIAAEEGPRRSVLIALWDGEEDEILGSTHYTTSSPIVPLEQTVAYVNFDIQGANLVPAAREITLAIGAETGGAALVEAVERAAAGSTLDTRLLSVLFGQGRSDHQSFVDAGIPAGIPSVFFTDATSACYHTAQDDVTAVDFDKLDQQIATVTALAHDLVTTNEPPVFDVAAPIASYEDAASMLAVATAVEPDLDLLGPDAASVIGQYLEALRSIVEAGPGAFDEDAALVLLGGATAFVDALTHGDCDALDP